MTESKSYETQGIHFTTDSNTVIEVHTPGDVGKSDTLVAYAAKKRIGRMDVDEPVIVGFVIEEQKAILLAFGGNCRADGHYEIKIVADDGDGNSTTVNNRFDAITKAHEGCTLSLHIVSNKSHIDRNLGQISMTPMVGKFAFVLPNDEQKSFLLTSRVATAALVDPQGRLEELWMPVPK